MIVDAGKMHVLDELLTKLKKEGHRVLIYSTMTKVIDLLEVCLLLLHLYSNLLNNSTGQYGVHRDPPHKSVNIARKHVFSRTTQEPVT